MAKKPIQTQLDELRDQFEAAKNGGEPLTGDAAATVRKLETQVKDLQDSYSSMQNVTANVEGAANATAAFQLLAEQVAQCRVDILRLVFSVHGIDATPEVDGEDAAIGAQLGEIVNG